jgi:hypothetical protein
MSLCLKKRYSIFKENPADFEFHFPKKYLLLSNKFSDKNFDICVAFKLHFGKPYSSHADFSIFFY